ncbi:MAG: family peptidase [Mucilaginibacter sp.]|nr:family peptidase [Mucilaginibacter sp.]
MGGNSRRYFLKNSILTTTGLGLLPFFAKANLVYNSNIEIPKLDRELIKSKQLDFHLHLVPDIIYKVDDPGGRNTSSFLFDIAVICSNNFKLTPISAVLKLSSAGFIVEQQNWESEMLAKIMKVSYRIVQETTSIVSPNRLFTLPESFDLRFYFRHPKVLAIDSAEVQLTVADPKGRQATQRLKIPVQYYTQKTPLNIPFHGLGVVGQDWITNGGHGGWWNQFALDLRGLDQNYAEQLNNAGENASDPGWNREILSPAAGTIVYVRNDVPDNPQPGEPDLKAIARLPEPAMTYAGNCVIIDHSNSEYSVMMHMRQGSVTVKKGQQIAAGQVIGRLGNSGDAFGPHLHYQLQTGPKLFVDQTLPFKFQNIDEPQLSRGALFSEK